MTVGDYRDYDWPYNTIIVRDCNCCGCKPVFGSREWLLSIYGEGAYKVSLDDKPITELGPESQLVKIKCSCGNIDEFVEMQKGEERSFRCFMGCNELVYAYGDNDVECDVVADYYDDVITIPEETSEDEDGNIIIKAKRVK